MKKENISEALNDVDFDMVEQAYENAPKIKAPVWRRWGALAACLLLIAGMIAAVPMFQADIPDWDASLLSAAELGSLFYVNTLGSNTLGTTAAYTGVEVSESKYLYVKELTNKEYMSVYQQQDTGKALNEKELRSFTDNILPRLSTALGVSLPQHEVKTQDSGSEPYLLCNELTTPYDLGTKQTATYNCLVIRTTRKDNRPISLNGVPLQIDRRLSDGEILNSLAAFKTQLFKVLGVSFPSTKLIREVDRVSGYLSFYVYFYDESAHPLNVTAKEPVSDHIRIDLYTSAIRKDKTANRNISQDAVIQYFKYRSDVNTTYPLVAKAKIISLEKAEELLYKGYVFSNRSHCLCASTQGKISFENYDFVGMEYLTTHPDSQAQGYCIPFYVFYQEIGPQANGNILYGKTYVAAIEVSGYEAYHESHKSRN